jgi:hypothetical protein
MDGGILDDLLRLHGVQRQKKEMAGRKNGRKKRKATETGRK